MLAGRRRLLGLHPRFRAVCRQWRSSATCPRGRGILGPCFYPRRWMLLRPRGPRPLPTGHGKLRGYIIRFFVQVNCDTVPFTTQAMVLFNLSVPPPKLVAKFKWPTNGILFNYRISTIWCRMQLRDFGGCQKIA